MVTAQGALRHGHCELTHTLVVSYVSSLLRGPGEKGDPGRQTPWLRRCGLAFLCCSLRRLTQSPGEFWAPQIRRHKDEILVQISHVNQQHARRSVQASLASSHGKPSDEQSPAPTSSARGSLGKCTRLGSEDKPPRYFGAGETDSTRGRTILSTGT